jgi:hypothetical protein
VIGGSVTEGGRPFRAAPSSFRTSARRSRLSSCHAGQTSHIHGHPTRTVQPSFDATDEDVLDVVAIQHLDDPQQIQGRTAQAVPTHFLSRYSCHCLSVKATSSSSVARGQGRGVPGIARTGRSSSLAGSAPSLMNRLSPPA